MGETYHHCTSKNVNVANLNYVVEWDGEDSDVSRKICNEIKTLNKTFNLKHNAATKCIICEIYANTKPEV